MGKSHLALKDFKQVSIILEKSFCPFTSKAGLHLYFSPYLTSLTCYFCFTFQSKICYQKILEIEPQRETMVKGMIQKCCEDLKRGQYTLDPCFSTGVGLALFLFQHPLWLYICFLVKHLSE